MKDNHFLDESVLIPAGLAAGSHILASIPWNGDASSMSYITTPSVDCVTHFWGGYAISRVSDRLYDSLTEKYDKLKTIPKDIFVLGLTTALGAVNEYGEVKGKEMMFAKDPRVYALFSETTENSVKDMLVNTAGCIAERYRAVDKMIGLLKK